MVVPHSGRSVLTNVVTVPVPQDTKREHMEGKVHDVKQKAARRVEDIAESERRIEKLKNDWENRSEPADKQALEAQRVSVMDTLEMLVEKDCS
jgi:5'-deoxynucleotidase YfbR-like HD superfamily hydrolase